MGSTDQGGSSWVTSSPFGMVVNSSELAPVVLAAQKGEVGSDGAGRANPAVVFVPVQPRLYSVSATFGMRQSP